MKAIDVEKIRFEFGESWSVAEKWDDSPIFRQGISRLNGEYKDEITGEVCRVGSKAVDIIGVRGDDLYLFEVKDFRGHAIETKRRYDEGLPLAIACKMRDTIAGLVGAGKRTSNPWTDTCHRILLRPNGLVHVVAWIEPPALRPSEPRNKGIVRDKVLIDNIKRLLSWLTAHVIVTSPFNRRIEDLDVHNLPGAGQS